MLPSIAKASSLLELVIPGIFISVLETQLTLSASMNHPHVSSNKLTTNERAHDLQIKRILITYILEYAVAHWCCTKGLNLRNVFFKICM